MENSASPNKRYKIRITGLVQGVGFRPYIYQKARRHSLLGFVRNDEKGVLIEVQGKECDIFLKTLPENAPPLSRIDKISFEEMPFVPEEHLFEIVTSHRNENSSVSTAIIPDSAICKDCLKELFDPNGRYYLYPFLNCTHCGPRYTIVKGLPYDRKMTSLASFKMCPECEKEYSDPADRRFHAQPTACQVCGPSISGNISEMVEKIRQGKIIAVKGLGGFHLVCDAKNDRTVSLLRQRKNREAKPFAAMGLNQASLENIVETNDSWQRSLDLLLSNKAPIVLAKRKTVLGIAPSVAPGLADLGIMLPYTPLHYLIFWEAAGRPTGYCWLEEALDFFVVMTSANPGDEPLVIGNEEAKERLSGICDDFLMHNRDILIRTDDSVVKTSAIGPIIVRRARGFVPEPIRLPFKGPPVLALGADLKNTICITRGDEAFVSQHIGELDNPSVLGFLRETVEHLLKILDVRPDIVCCDMHQDFFSSGIAEEYGLKFNAKKVSIQHHHAHIAAMAAEHGINEPFLGLALDGFGLSETGELWGGEVLFNETLAKYERVGHLQAIKQPGLDMAAKEAWRMGVSLLWELNLSNEIEKRYHRIKGLGVLLDMLEKGLNSPNTTSMGRLFDAAASILGVCQISRYEAEAPMLLESLVTSPTVFSEGWEIAEKNQISFLPLFRKLVSCSQVEGANFFHGTVAKGLATLVAKIAKEKLTTKVVLAGGCFLNRILIEQIYLELKTFGLDPFLPKNLPPNDGSISFGQAVIAMGKKD